MTNVLLQKLEEKIMALVTELDSTRLELARVKQENSQMKTEYSDHTKKLQDLMALLDAFEAPALLQA